MRPETAKCVLRKEKETGAPEREAKFLRREVEVGWKSGKLVLRKILGCFGNFVVIQLPDGDSQLWTLLKFKFATAHACLM